MPVSEISTVLNNCALHALVETIKHIIENMEAEDNDILDKFPAYDSLRIQFIDFYELDDLSWENWSVLLNKYNDLDRQILMGPVLRRFMATQIEKFGNEHDYVSAESGEDSLISYAENKPEFIKYLTEIPEDTDVNRYMSLSPLELHKFVGSPLGINIFYAYKDPMTGDWKIEEELKSEHHIEGSQVTIYHEGGLSGASDGGHFETTPDAENRIDKRGNEDTLLKTILLLLSGEHPQGVTFGFGLLKRHVKFIAQHRDVSIDDDHTQPEGLAQINDAAAALNEICDSSYEEEFAKTLRYLYKGLNLIAKELIEDSEFYEGLNSIAKKLIEDSEFNELLDVTKSAIVPEFEGVAEENKGKEPASPGRKRQEPVASNLSEETCRGPYDSLRQILNEMHAEYTKIPEDKINQNARENAEFIYRQCEDLFKVIKKNALGPGDIKKIEKVDKTLRQAKTNLHRHKLGISQHVVNVFLMACNFFISGLRMVPLGKNIGFFDYYRKSNLNGFIQSTEKFEQEISNSFGFRLNKGA